MDRDWPPRWELTAPESHVLSYRGGSWGGEAIRLACAELVARGVVRLDEVEVAGLWRTKRSWTLADGPAAGATVEPPLDVMLDVIRSAGAMPLSVASLKRALRKRFRSADRYREQHVAPALVDRGLLELTRPRRRGRAAEFDWTEAGRRADEQLALWLELARDHLADWVEADPARAARFTREAGSAVLLMEDQLPQLEELSRQSAGVAGVGGGEAFAFGATAHGHHAGLGSEGFQLDFGGLDFGGLGDLGGGFGGGGHGGGGHGGGH